MAWGQTTVTDELTYSLIGVSSTTYSSWSGKTSNSSAVYAGQSAGGNNSIQLRSKNSNSGIVTTTSGGKVKSVTITFNTNTSSSGQLDVYGKNTAYTSAEDLYKVADEGTKLGSAKISEGNSTTISITDDYEFIGFRSYNGAVYIDKIEIVWETGGSVNPALETTTTINVPTDFNTDVYTNTTAGQLTATVKAGEETISDATVSWSSSNENVATIDESTGEVTLVSAGTVIFTARYAGVSGTYQSSSDTYEMTVTDSTPFSGGDVTFVCGTDKTSEASLTKNGVTMSFTASGDGTWDRTDNYRLYANKSLTISTETGTITKIAFTISQNNFSGEGYDNTTKEWTGNAKSVTLAADGGQVRFTPVVVTVNMSATPDPTFTISNNEEIAYNATSGSFDFTVNNPVNDGVTTVSENVDWISDAAISGNSVSFNTTVNNAAASRSGVITLTYTYGTNNETVTKEVTVTQAGNPNITNIPDLFAAANSTAATVSVTFNNWVVSGVSTNGKNVFVTDNNGNGFVIFNSDGGLGDTYAVGSILSGTVSCSLKKNYGYAQLTGVSGLTITTGGSVTEASIEMANLAGVNTGALVSYDNLICHVSTSGNYTNYDLTDGTTTIRVYNSLFAFDALEPGKTYNITGIYQQYSNTKEILPRNAEDIEEVAEPSVVPATTSVSVNSEEHTGSIAVTVNNAPDALFEVEWCNASGDAAEYDWITAGRNGDVIEYAIQENTTTEARTAYLRAFIMYNDEKISSDLITVTQAGVVVDYATLPYSYDGTGAMIEYEIGLTESGVGSNNSKPGIKFDSTGDYVVLKMNEAPKTLYFDIKGNPGSGTSTVGTFKVQTSADGITYTDLETYTNKDNTLQKEMFVNFASEVRFIKWIYVEKKSGNIALGNIIASNVAPETIDVSIGEKSTGADGAYYSSVYYSNKSLKVPEGVECLTYKVVDGALTVSKTYNAGDVIPAGEAVVIKVSVYDGTVTFMVAPTTNVKDTESMLLGVDGATSISEPGYKYYKLTLNAAKEEGTAGFYFDKGVTDGSTINAAANKCYLRVPVDQTNGAKGFVFGEETDGINAIDNSQQQIVEGIYNLAGQRVNKAQKGIYIVNGKKVVVK